MVWNRLVSITANSGPKQGFLRTRFGNLGDVRVNKNSLKGESRVIVQVVLGVVDDFRTANWVEIIQYS